MVYFYKKKFETTKEKNLTIIIKDNDLNMCIKTSITYRNTNSKIKISNVTLTSSATLATLEHGNEKVSDYQILFDEQNKTIIKEALDFHKEKFKQETILHRMFQKHKILEMFD